MIRAIVFVEEESARIVVECIAERLAPGQSIVVVSHQGKSDLVKSFPRKMGAWKHPADVPFIVLHDNDGGDCHQLKRHLQILTPKHVRERVHTRIVMQCLESWYLGDPAALELAGLISQEKKQRMVGKAKFRKPEEIVKAKEEFFRLHAEVGQMNIARLVAPHLDLDNNRCESFNLFVKTLRAVLG